MRDVRNAVRCSTIAARPVTSGPARERERWDVDRQDHLVAISVAICFVRGCSCRSIFVRNPLRHSQVGRQRTFADNRTVGWQVGLGLLRTSMYGSGPRRASAFTDRRFGTCGGRRCGLDCLMLRLGSVQGNTCPRVVYFALICSPGKRVLRCAPEEWLAGRRRCRTEEPAAWGIGQCWTATRCVPAAGLTWPRDRPAVRRRSLPHGRRRRLPS